MWIKREKPSRLLLILGEYFGFSMLSGFVSILFFKWASKVITENYTLKTGMEVSYETQYWISLIIITAGVLLAVFVLGLLLQQKFSYMIQISKAVEEMEAGNLSKRIELMGEDELTDLAARINSLAETMEEQFRVSDQMKQERVQTIASLSHDIRTPLTSVMSYLQFIRDQQYKDAGELASYAQKAYEKAYRIKEMTDSLFENCIKDLEEQKPLEEVDGNRFLKQIFFDIKEFLEESGFLAEVSSMEGWPQFYLKINREKIARVFDNLISNIEKYADSREPIRIWAAISGKELIITQQNAVITEYQKTLVESHLLGLKGVERMIQEIKGSISILEESGIFTLVIHLPIS